MVIKRWYDMRDAIKEVGSTDRYGVRQSVLPYQGDLLDKLKARLRTQTTPINWTARALDPSMPNVMNAFDHSDKQAVITFITTYTPQDRLKETIAQFAQFRHQSGVFDHADQAIWSLKDQPVDFWNHVDIFAPDLAGLASRLWACPANSVPSERAFSSTNFIQNRFRSRLGTDRTSHLAYIYMNLRALRRGDILRSTQIERHQARVDRLGKQWEDEKKQRLEEIQSAIKYSVLEAMDDDLLFDLEAEALSNIDPDCLTPCDSIPLPDNHSEFAIFDEQDEQHGLGLLATPPHPHPRPASDSWPLQLIEPLQQCSVTSQVVTQGTQWIPESGQGFKDSQSQVPSQRAT